MWHIDKSVTFTGADIGFRESRSVGGRSFWWVATFSDAFGKEWNVVSGGGGALCVALRATPAAYAGG